MTYTVSNLITDAYYASGIVSREFETVSGQQMALGLSVLNNILSDKAIEKDMIPYYTKYTFNVVSGQESYFIPKLEQLDTLVFYLNTVRYQMRQVSRIPFRGSSRADNVKSLPFNWNLERCLGGSLLSLYFFPDKNYPLEAWGLFRLSEVSMNQDLSFTGTKANLGTVTIFGTAPASGILTSGQLVINGVDLAGIYNTAQALANHINSGVIPNVSCTYIANQLTLIANVDNFLITVTTLGDVDITSGLNFSEFSLTNGPHEERYSSTGLDQFYISYLKFALADRLCTEYNFIVPPGVVKQLVQYQGWISKRSGGLDLGLQKISTLAGHSPLNWGQINLGKGFTT